MQKDDIWTVKVNRPREITQAEIDEQTLADFQFSNPNVNVSSASVQQINLFNNYTAYLLNTDLFPTGV